jgi:glucosamine--fructose-6-phosphate aminotransferase (isomerizing)
MCGIVGYRGEKKASRIVYKGLKKLEYRGYDSAGIATVHDEVHIDKGEGTIDQVSTSDKPGNTSIGHTRWATHGGVNDTNAHPHTSTEDEIAVVHNGIINNYEELKKEIGEHLFESETDTEVIPKLVEEELRYTDNTLEAVKNTIERIEGSYAVALVTEDDELIAFKNGSPLVIGSGEDEHFIASDVTPFLEHTEDAVFLEDGDIAVVEKDGFEIHNNGEKVEREVTRIDWDAQQASKKEYNHYMKKEILEQPKTVKRAAFQDKSDMEEAKKMVEEAETVYLTAAGTSSFAADLGAKYLRECGINAVSEQAHEMEYRTEEVDEDDLVIGISQSGETADLLAVTNEIEAPLLSVLNVKGSTLDRDSDHTLLINAGPEIGVASTKAFTGQVAVLKLLKYTVEDKLREGRDSLVQTADHIETVLEDNEETIHELSEFLKEEEHVYFIGRHTSYDLAKEADLKLKELSYIHSESFPGGEFKHGNISLVEDGTPVVSFIGDTGREDIISNTKEAESRGANITTVDSEDHGFSDFHIQIPEDENDELLKVVPFQVLAYRTSLKLDNNPDKPRNLAKSVTVK